MVSNKNRNKLFIFTILIAVVLSATAYLIYIKKYFFALIFLFFMIMIIYFIFLMNSLNILRRKDVFLKRSKISIFIVSFLMLIIILRFVQIQIFEKNKYISMMNNQVLGFDETKGERGSIFDKNGKKLAFNHSYYTMFIDPSLLNDERVADNLLIDLKLIINSKILKLDKNILKEINNLASQNKKYKILAKNIDEEKKNKILEIIEEGHKNAKESSKRKYKTLLGFEKTIKRKYFYEKEYEKMIGLYRFTETSKDKKIGISGLEKQYENYLAEKKRTVSKLYSLNKKSVLPLSKDVVYSDINGKNLHLTIDSEINLILNDEVKRQFSETHSKEAYGIIMEPDTGKILAVSAYSKNKDLIRNNLFQSQYEPGSIFKPLIMAAALNEKFFSSNSKFNVEDGTITRHGKIIRESSRSTKGVITAAEIIKKSSNVGMVLVSDYFSNELFEKYLKNYGLYNKTNVDFPNELKPYSLSYKKWDRLKKNTMAFGQGIAVTPIQMITAFSAVINGGVLYRPYLVEKITDSNGLVIRRNIPTKVRRVISEETSKIIRKILMETVENGTGKKAYIEGYHIGGKTGTAQLSAGKSGYEKEEYLASFIGFFPVDKPKYIVMVMFMRPQSDIMYKKFGGYVSAPVVGNIAKRIIKKEELFSKNISKINYKNLKKLDYIGRTFDKDLETMPDLKGMSPKEVVELFKDKDIEIVGKGLIDKQYPKVGEDLNNTTKIKIFLK